MDGVRNPTPVSQEGPCSNTNGSKCATSSDGPFPVLDSESCVWSRNELARACPCLPTAVLGGPGPNLRLDSSSFLCSGLFRISALGGSSACSKPASGNSERDTALALTEDIFPLSSSALKALHVTAVKDEVCGRKEEHYSCEHPGFMRGTMGSCCDLGED